MKKVIIGILIIAGVNIGYGFFGTMIYFNNDQIIKATEYACNKNPLTKAGFTSYMLMRGQNFDSLQRLDQACKLQEQLEKAFSGN